MRIKTNQYKIKTNKDYSEEYKNRPITIKKGRWINERDGIRHNMIYERKNMTGERIYCLYTYGKKDDFGIFVKLNWYQNQKFLFIQNAHYFQKGESYKNVIIPALSVLVGILIGIYLK